MNVERSSIIEDNEHVNRLSTPERCACVRQRILFDQEQRLAFLLISTHEIDQRLNII
jgi:hypothetical protein